MKRFQSFLVTCIVLGVSISAQAGRIYINSAAIGTKENVTEFIVTDPSGRSTGYDPTVPINDIVHIPIRMDIPHAGYSIWGLGDDDEESDGTHGTPSGRECEIHHASSGTYILKVTGIAESGWYIEIGYNQDRERPDIRKDPRFSLRGLTRPGFTVSYDLLYSPVPGEPVGVKKIVTFASLTEEIKIARRLNLIKNQGIQTSLLSKLSASQQAKDRNQPKTAGNVLSALLKEVSAQKDKGIDKTAAAIFTESIQALLSELR